MLIKKSAIIFFLAYAFVLVAGRSLTPNEEDEIRSERGLGEFIQSVADAAINTVKEETNSISNSLHSFKETIGKFADAGKKVMETGWVAATAAPQIGINILTGNTENGIIRGPYEHFKESVSGAVESIKDASANAITSGFMAAKTTWDLSTFLPKFGINLVKDKEFFKKLEEALKKTYEEEKLSVSQAIGSVKNAGQKLKAISKEVTETTLEVARSIPKLALDSIKYPENDDENMRKFEEIRNKVKGSFELIKEAAGHIKAASDDVTRAGVDLSIAVPKYGLNLLDEKDRKNLDQIVKKEVEEIRMSIKKAVVEIAEAVKKIQEATTQSTKAGLEIGFILPHLGYNIYNQDEKDLADAIRQTLEQTQKSIKKALEKIQTAGEKIFVAGEDVAVAGWKLGTSVPKIGISILSEQKDKIDEDKIQSLNEQKDEFLDLLNEIQANGKKLQELGIGVSKNSEEKKIQF